MVIKSLNLQNFRSYTKSEFTFSYDTTVIVGPNTSGKSNLIEAIAFLSTGKSFRTENDKEAILFEKEIARIKGSVEQNTTGGVEGTMLEVVLTTGLVGGQKAPYKKFLVNGVSKRRVDFAGLVPTVIFSPLDLEIIIGGPSKRRDFLDFVLEQVDFDYRHAVSLYAKALRQRNALLELTQTSGAREEKQFEYWDSVLIQNGQIITKTREAFIEFINTSTQEIFDCTVEYDKSTISPQRLLQYQDAEVAAGNTLVGPHRDDVVVFMNGKESTPQNVKLYGSRGQQRLTVLQLKVLQLVFIEKKQKERPLLLMDDIFSELDEGHIQLVLDIIGKQQTILTTTHKEFIDEKLIKNMSVVELEP